MGKRLAWAMRQALDNGKVAIRKTEEGVHAEIAGDHFAGSAFAPNDAAVTYEDVIAVALSRALAELDDQRTSA